MSNKYTVLSFLFLASSVAAVPTQNASTLYDQITGQIIGENVLNTKAPVVLDVKKLSLQKTVPSDAAIRSVYGTQFKNLVLTENQTVIVDYKTLNALGIIQERGSLERGISSKIPTQTVGGMVYKNIKLAFPSNDLSDIQKSQAVVKALVDNESVQMQLSESLARLQKAENQMMSFFEDEHPANKMLFDELYYSWIKAGNKSPNALDFRYRLNNFHTFTKMLLSLDLKYVMALPVTIAQGYFIAKENSLSSGITHAVLEPLKDAARAIKNTPSGLYQAGAMVFDQAVEPAVRVGVGIGICGLLGVNGYFLYRGYTAYQQEKKYNEYTVYMQERLNAAAEYVRCIHELNALITEHAALHDNLLYANHLSNIVTKQNCSPACAELLTMLETNTFMGEPSFSLIKGAFYLHIVLCMQ